MAQKLALYSVYVKEGNDLNGDGLVFVKEGWSWMAAIFNALWAGFHGLWWVCAVLFLIQLIFGLVGVPADPVWADIVIILKFGFMVIVGLNASDWHSWSLLRKKYRFIGVASGHSECEAQQRFFDQHMRQANPSSVMA
jgi:hypothetical protein